MRRGWDLGFKRDPKIKGLYYRGEVLPEEIRDWVATDTNKVVFEVLGNCVSCEVHGHFTAANMRPMLATIVEFADRLDAA